MKSVKDPGVYACGSFCPLPFNPPPSGILSNKKTLTRSYAGFRRLSVPASS